MGSEGGEAASRGTLVVDLRIGLEATPGAAAGVRARITMTGNGEPLDWIEPAATAGLETATNSSPTVTGKWLAAGQNGEIF